MILYPTETIYGLGVNALLESEVAKLYELKGREGAKGVSWLVRDISDIEKYGELSPVAAAIAEQFLPGPLTLVLKAKDIVPEPLRGPGDTVSFRISPDPIAQEVIARFMAEHNAPLTCTSANVSGVTPENTPEAILKQFGEKAAMIDEVVDDGERQGLPSTVVSVIDDQVQIIRDGAIPAAEILAIESRQ